MSLTRLSSFLRIFSTILGVCISPSRSWFISPLPRTPLISAIFKDIRAKLASCTMKVFVAATPISGPACVYRVRSDNLEMVLPMTLVTEIIFAPLFLANLTAFRVSAVSPDWLIARIVVS